LTLILKEGDEEERKNKAQTKAGENMISGLQIPQLTHLQNIQQPGMRSVL